MIYRIQSDRQYKYWVEQFPINVNKHIQIHENSLKVCISKASDVVEVAESNKKLTTYIGNFLSPKVDKNRIRLKDINQPNPITCVLVKQFKIALTENPTTPTFCDKWKQSLNFQGEWPKLFKYVQDPIFDSKS